MNEQTSAVVRFGADIAKEIHISLADSKIDPGEIFGVVAKLLPASGLWNNRQAIAAEWAAKNKDYFDQIDTLIDTEVDFLTPEVKKKVMAIIRLAFAGILAIEAFSAPKPAEAPAA